MRAVRVHRLIVGLIVETERSERFGRHRNGPRVAFRLRRTEHHAPPAEGQ